MRTEPHPAPRLIPALLSMSLGVLVLLGNGALAATDSGPRPHAKGDYDAASNAYSVAAGDDLTTIGRRFDISVAELKALNALSEDRILLEDSHFGKFPQDLMDEAKEKGWHVISMKDDWKRIFAADE